MMNDAQLFSVVLFNKPSNTWHTSVLSSSS